MEGGDTSEIDVPFAVGEIKMISINQLKKCDLYLEEKVRASVELIPVGHCPTPAGHLDVLAIVVEHDVLQSQCPMSNSAMVKLGDCFH